MECITFFSSAGEDRMLLMHAWKAVPVEIVLTCALSTTVATLPLYLEYLHCFVLTVSLTDLRFVNFVDQFP